MREKWKKYVEKFKSLGDKVSGVKGITAVIPAVCLAVLMVTVLTGYKTPQAKKYEASETEDISQIKEALAKESTAATAETTKKNTTKKGKKGAIDVKDGTYKGSANGYGGKVTVNVTVSKKTMTAIDVVSAPGETDSFFQRAKGVIDEMLTAQSTDVDVVSGATYSSNGIISAVKNALTGAADSGTPASTSAGASGGSSSPAGGSSSVSTVQDASAYADGTYYGTGTGFSGALTVEVVISGGKISSIQIIDTSDGDSYIQSASGLISNIIATQSTNVDTVSGATYSSVGIIEAVRNALSQAVISSDGNSNSQNTNSSSNGSGQNSNNSNDNTTAEAGKFPYKEGVYYGTAEGYLDDIKVAIVIQDKTLKAVVIVEENDDETFFKRARTVAENMVKKQTVDVDVVSGATYSSKGIIGAVKEALKEAEKATKGENDNSNNNNNNNNNNNSNNNNGNNSNNNGNNNNNGNDNNGNDNNGGNNGDNENPDETKYIYADGEYTVIVPCLPNEDGDFEAYSLTMKVTISKDKITDISEIKGDGSSDNDAYIKRAVQGTSKLPGVVTQILEKGTLEEIDTVSRATCSSNSILEGCNLALETAKKVQSGEDTGEDSDQENDSNQNTEENAGDETP